ncbi:MAG: hydroxymethylglutaryl-CoA lyase, partial [Pseudomonadota bacterium]
MAEIEIVEMAPRDGLQNEAVQVPTKDKVALIDALSTCGFKRVEATAFVSPKWVPQMADAADVMAS